MPTFGPIKQRDLLPYLCGKHPFMVKGNLTITVANPHKRDIGQELLARILRQAQVSREEWERL